MVPAKACQGTGQLSDVQDVNELNSSETKLIEKEELLIHCKDYRVRFKGLILLRVQEISFYEKGQQ